MYWHILHFHCRLVYMLIFFTTIQLQKKRMLPALSNSKHSRSLKYGQVPNASSVVSFMKVDHFIFYKTFLFLLYLLCPSYQFLVALVLYLVMHISTSFLKPAQCIQQKKRCWKGYIIMWSELISSLFCAGLFLKVHCTCKDRITTAKPRTDPLSYEKRSQTLPSPPLPLSPSPSLFIAHCYFCRCICSDLFFSSHLLMIHALGFLAPSF